jgi:hypothetical protein
LLVGLLVDLIRPCITRLAPPPPNGQPPGNRVVCSASRPRPHYSRPRLPVFVFAPFLLLGATGQCYVHARIQAGAELNPLGSYSSCRRKNRILTHFPGHLARHKQVASRASQSLFRGKQPKQGAGAEACLPRAIRCHVPLPRIQCSGEKCSGPGDLPASPPALLAAQCQNRPINDAAAVPAA